ncbi:MAG: phytanoyl-CoA dioxygenase family protein [Myxococcales bacterium]|nr:phytanoyl-CoA dioxygenase family protein [Myxococcales bacterium]
MPRQATFARDGVVQVLGAVAPDEVAALRASVWATLAAHGLERDDPRTWRPGGGLGLVEIAGALRPGPAAVDVLWAIGRAPAFATLPAALTRAVDDVFGIGRWAPVDDQHGGLAAPNFPSGARAWAVPHAAWHVDEPTAASQAMAWGLLAFLFLDDVAPGGGATVAVAGSHRWLGAVATARAGRAPPELVTTEVALAARAGRAPTELVTTDVALAALGRDAPELAGLCRPDGERPALEAPYRARGVELRVVELTGAPGDLVLMDPRLLHTVSANVSTRARLTMRLVCARQA